MPFPLSKYQAALLGLVALFGPSFNALAQPAQPEASSTPSASPSAGNPYLQNMFGTMANAVTPRVASAFEGAGRYGSGAYANALSSALTDTAGNLAYQNYANERGNMLRADALAPTLANQDYTDIGQLAAAGQPSARGAALTE